jgi:hypothetical protein
MSKKRIGSTVTVVAMGIIVGGAFACSSSNGGGGFPEGSDGGNGGNNSNPSGSTSGTYTTSNSSGGTYTTSSSSGTTGTYTTSSSGTYTTSSSGTTSGSTTSSGSTATGGAYSGPTDSSAIKAMTAGSMGCGGYYDITGLGSGYAFAFTDATTDTTSCATVTPMGKCPASPTTIASDATALCASGTTSVVNAPDYTCYGGGFGINLGQMMGGTTNTPINAPSASTGIAYSLTGYTSASNGMRIQVAVGTTNYCAVLMAASGSVKWSDFNTKCYDTPADGTALSGPPQGLSQIEFQVNAGSSSFTFGVCIDSLSFSM